MKISREELRELQRAVASRICSGCNSISAVKNILQERGIKNARLEQELLCITKGVGGFRAGV